MKAVLLLAIAAASTATAMAQLPPQCAASTTPAQPLSSGSHEVTLNGARLWYCVAGDAQASAPPVVFLHGGPGSNSHAFAVITGPIIERSLRMVYLDQRGSGRSERPATGDYAIATLVNDVEALRKQLGVPQIVVLGHSFGGLLALEYAARYPEHTAKVIFAGGLFDAPAQCEVRKERLIASHPEAAAQALADSAIAAAVRRSACELEFRAFRGAARTAYTNALMFPDSTVRIRMEQVEKESGLHNTGELGRYLFEKENLSQYRFKHPARLTMPVLVVVGRHDGAAHGPPQENLARSLPNGRYLELEDAGHFLYLDQPERFTKVVTDFVTTR